MEKTKMTLSFSFYLRGSVRLKAEYISSVIQYKSIPTKLYTDPSGFTIETGYDLSFNEHSLTLPTYVPYNTFNGNESELFSFYTFSSDTDRYDGMKRLYDILERFSQSRIFQYDNQGHIEVINNKWYVY